MKQATWIVVLATHGWQHHIKARAFSRFDFVRQYHHFMAVIYNAVVDWNLETRPHGMNFVRFIFLRLRKYAA